MTGLSSITDYAQAVNAGDFDDDPGVRFLARKGTIEKGLARNRVVSIVQRLSDPKKGLRVLTMPSVAWSFEKHLINNREHGKGKWRPRNTYLTAIESHPAIYRAACLTIPSADRGVVVLGNPPFAKQTIRTYAIGRFYECAFEDYAWAQADEPFVHDFAWLDFCGQISTRRLDALNSLWTYGIRRGVVITSLRGRWEAGLNQRIAEHGVAGEIQRWLPGATLYDEHEYGDGVAMHQVTFVKAAS